MRTLLVLLLVVILVVASIDARKGKGNKRGKGGKGGKVKGGKVIGGKVKGGKVTPCGRWKSLVSCTCEDGKEYVKGTISKNCGLKTKNPVESCLCKGGIKWNRRKKTKKTKKKTKKTKKKSPVPCGKRSNVEQCTCDSGKIVKKGVIQRKCKGRKNIKSCQCKDGTTYERKEKPQPTTTATVAQTTVAPPAVVTDAPPSDVNP